MEGRWTGRCESRWKKEVEQGGGTNIWNKEVEHKSGTKNWNKKLEQKLNKKREQEAGTTNLMCQGEILC